MYEKELQNLGLSEKEAKIYLAALELGPETAQNIARKTGVNRATTYAQIDSLKKHGLVSEIERDGKTLFMAESPDRLLSLFNSLEKELNFKKDEISRVLPVLTNLFKNAGERPKVRFYEGKEGVLAINEEFLKVKNKTVESIINLDKLFEMFPNYEDEYSSQRIAKGIKSKVIYTRNDGPVSGDTDEKKLREAKFIPFDKFPLAAQITIFDNKVSLMTYRVQPINVIIESDEIASSIRALFNFFWNNF